MNVPAEQWVLNPKKLEKGLFLVAVGARRIPVTNQICPKCNHGWSNCKFAVYKNRVFHKRCLMKWKGKKFDKLVAIGEIDTE